MSPCANCQRRDRYVFPCVLRQEPEGLVTVMFPDFNCATYGFQETDALEAARELLCDTILHMEENGERIPIPTPTAHILAEENERVVSLQLDLSTLRLPHDKTNT